ncbi:MAG: histidinol dehydrogenase [Armatimonadetes bacterium JP3_11]|nr:MAG: histidinol dehydrogenase [Armatimonadetes bacterium JP3_11]RMH07253.1 MAG: histidinol dehydrogenase [Armatimonadota bacterium]
MLPTLEASTEPRARLLARLKQGASQPTPEMEAQVRTIIERVRSEGDRAVLEYTRQWDSPTLESLEVAPAEFEAAYQRIDPAVMTAIQHAIARVRRFHEPMRPSSWHLLEAQGGWLGQMVRPLERVGVYAPGGRAQYPSTVIMNAVPAKVAGVEEVILCTPPRHDGTIPPSVLVAAREAGVSRVFKVGGAQAIAAMAYGTQTLPAVEKIVGPGNLYVALAKRMLWGIVGVDLWAGPSEVAIIADESANPAYIAADLLTQLEHGAESVGYLFTPSRTVLQQTLAALEQQLAQRTRRATLEQALAHSLAVLTRSLPEAFELANAAAPEHLTLMVHNPMQWLAAVRNAGCILLGDTPQAAGDYVAGPSHTLPTGRAARFESPVSVETFLKRSSVIALSRDALRTLAPDILALAHEEGFDAHAAAVQIRISEE